MTAPILLFCALCGQSSQFSAPPVQAVIAAPAVQRRDSSSQELSDFQPPRLSAPASLSSRPSAQPTPALPLADAPPVLIPPARQDPSRGQLQLPPFRGAEPQVEVLAVGQPANGRGSRETRSLADNLLRDAIARGKSATAAGEEFQLQQLLSTPTGRTQHKHVVWNYWDLCSSLARLHFANEERQLLENLDGSGEAVHRRALVGARTRQVEAQIAVVDAQFRLAELASIPIGQRLPLPADAPLVGPYRTEFEPLHRQRAVPDRMRRIDRTLPLRQQLIVTYADGIRAARSALQTTQRDHETGRATSTDAVAAVDHLRQQRMAFLDAVRQYNCDIAEYALAVARPTDSAARLVAMMIKSEPGVSSLGPGVVMQTSAIQPTTTGGPVFAAPQQTIPSLPPSNSVLVQPAKALPSGVPAATGRQSFALPPTAPPRLSR